MHVIVGVVPMPTHARLLLPTPEEAPHTVIGVLLYDLGFDVTCKNEDGDAAPRPHTHAASLLG